MPPAPPPLIDRIVGHPLVRSGYASILAHLAIAIVLAILASRENPPPRPPPLLLAFGDDHLRDADDDAIQMDRAVELAPLDAPADAGGERIVRPMALPQPCAQAFPISEPMDGW